MSNDYYWTTKFSGQRSPLNIVCNTNITSFSYVYIFLSEGIKNRFLLLPLQIIKEMSFKSISNNRFIPNK